MMKPTISRYDFKQGLPRAFEIVSLSHIYSLHKELMTVPHRTNFYHILWFESGTTKHTVDFRTIPICPNTLVFMSKDVVHRFEENPDITGKAIVFMDDFFCKTEQDTLFLQNNSLFNSLYETAYLLTPNSPNTFSTLWDMMERELQYSPDQYQSDMLQNLLHNFLMAAERERKVQGFQEMRKGMDRDYTLAFTALVDKHFKTVKSVRFFAHELAITEHRLHQAVTKMAGKTPKEAIDERVMLEAKRLLAHTTGSVKEIGLELGFEEATNFNKFFKKHAHQTPADFRNSFL